MDRLREVQGIEITEEVRAPSAALERGGEGKALLQGFPAGFARSIAAKQDRATLHVHASDLVTRV